MGGRSNNVRENDDSIKNSPEKKPIRGVSAASSSKGKALPIPKGDSPSKINLGKSSVSEAFSTRDNEPFKNSTRLMRFQTSPNLETGPETFITPPTPTETKSATFDAKEPGKESSDTIRSDNVKKVTINSTQSPKGSNLINRRIRAAANATNSGKTMSMPLTPHIEETKTPGGTLTNPLAPAGFFTSVFSVAQNAASQITNITSPSNSTNTRNKSSFFDGRKDIALNAADGEEVLLANSADEASSLKSTSQSKQLAVETLGAGDLTLNHLGISDASSSPSPYASGPDYPSLSQGAELEQSSDNKAAARAISAAYSERPYSEKSLSLDRSRAVVEQQAGGQTPPRAQTEPDPSIKRSGSIRSRISGGRRRRNRGSSVTTNGGIVGQGLVSSSATLLNIHSQASRSRHTGFAAASSKRNRDFHQLFKSVPEDDYLIDDYSAALQKEILLHGRMYISEGHICFSSNILGWVTNLIISFDEVVSVEKKSTAVIFPNAIIIQTLHARNVFASFLSRDTTYDLIVGIWKSGHPNLKSSLNGITVEGNANGDKTIKAESMESEEESEEGSEDEVYDEDVEEDESIMQNEASEITLTTNDAALGASSMSRQPSGTGLGISSTTTAAKVADAAEAIVAGTLATADYPGPGTHSVTECGDSEQHLEKMIMDTTLPAPLGKIYSLMFGPSSHTFMYKWLMEDQKCTEVQLDEKGLGSEFKMNNISYVKPLNGPIGPKQTRCITAQRLDQFDLESAVTVECTTQNPDVPSGNVFVVKTRYCLMWGPANSTRLITTCVVEWSGKSWLKGPIEKGANDGQTQYARDLTSALRGAVTRPSRANLPGARGGKAKAKRRQDDSLEQPVKESSMDQIESSRGVADDSSGQRLRSLYHPFLRMLSDTAASTPVAGLLVIFLIYWVLSRSFGFFGYDSRSQINQFGHGNLPSAARIAAYEEMWRAEESELWAWLEDRAGIAQVLGGVQGEQEREGKRLAKSSWERALRNEMNDERLDDQQVSEALRVTEERIKVLKSMMEKRKAERAEKLGGRGSRV